eukprot:scaffold4212_cov52-Attheya_sp.AAC.4
MDNCETLRTCRKAHPLTRIGRRFWDVVLLVIAIALLIILRDVLSNSDQFETNIAFRQTKSMTTTSKVSSPPKAQQIFFIGERHSGTNWMFDHLVECFGDDIKLSNSMTRWKHWFQYEDPLRIQNALVIAQFRHPYDWVHGMFEYAHHSPAHFKMSNWKPFVTKPWTMERPADDLQPENATFDEPICRSRAFYNDIMPCLQNSTNYYYELRRDGSGLPYDSIVDLRRDKILNFLNVSQFEGVTYFRRIRYEDQVIHGTAEFLTHIEGLTGVKAKCTPLPPHVLDRKPMDPRFIRWMNNHVDWETENLIGYEKLDVVN